MSDRQRGFLTRRELITACAIAGGTHVAGINLITQLEPASDPRDAFRGGTCLGLLNFVDEPAVPLDTVYGTELDGRLVTDLSDLTPENRVTPNGRFYIRTRASDLLDNSKPWTVRIGGVRAPTIALTLDRLKSMARPCGLHLMECAGNSRAVHFGLLSAAEWTGVPISEILDTAGIENPARCVLISGFDRYV